MLMKPSVTGKTPVGTPVGWSLPCWGGIYIDRPAGRLKVHHEDLRFEQARRHPSALAGADAVEERDHDPEREGRAGGHIGDRDPDPQRALAREAGDGH